MARLYSVSGPTESAASVRTAVSLLGGTTVRTFINEVIWGVDATPADNYLRLATTRWTTSAGTAASAPTPNPLDPADVASVTTAGITHSAEPTYASVQLLDISMNQRATFRWVAQDGRELKNPATATTGLGNRNIASGAALAPRATVIFGE